MCLNCGCGQPDLRHKETDLVREDVQRAADGQGSSMETTVRNIETSLRDIAGSRAATGARNDGGVASTRR